MRYVLLALALLAGCQAETPTPEIAPLGSPADPPRPVVPAPSERLSGPSGCFLVAEDAVAAYARPSREASRFGTLAPGDSAYVGGRTEGGWIGFAPGTAQAANVGPFRFRYVEARGPIRLVGEGCAALPGLPDLPPRTCFLMAMGKTPVYARADTSAAVAGLLAPQGYAEVTQRTAAGWAEVRLGVRTGWVGPRDVNLSGDCNAAPEP